MKEVKIGLLNKKMIVNQGPVQLNIDKHSKDRTVSDMIYGLLTEVAVSHPNKITFVQTMATIEARRTNTLVE